MLVLTRTVGQRIYIGPDIEVYVVEIKGQSVRLGITAPLSVEISRPDMANGEPKHRPTLPLLRPAELDEIDGETA